MLYPILADLVVLLHAAFVVFAVLGGLLVFRWERAAWVHLPAVLWAAGTELAGWICPLTPLENWLRQQEGNSGYGSDFIAHYLLPVLYPAGLTRQAQMVLGVLLVAINLAIYGWAWRRKSRARR